MARQIPIPLSLKKQTLEIGKLPTLRDLLETAKSGESGKVIDDGMQVTAPLDPDGHLGGTRQAYDSNRTVEGYDKRQ